jgi:hypothetical protein
VFFNNVTVAAFDQNAGSILNGAIANDISVVVSDVLGNSTAGRSDFNFNDAVQANDISFEVNDVLSNRSLSNVGAANACP